MRVCKNKLCPHSGSAGVLECQECWPAGLECQSVKVPYCQNVIIILLDEQHVAHDDNK